MTRVRHGNSDSKAILSPLRRQSGKEKETGEEVEKEKKTSWRTLLHLALAQPSSRGFD